MSNDIRELHADVRSVWIALTMMLGHPEQVVRYGCIRPPVYRDLSFWLHNLEQLFRRILLFIALGIPSLPYQPGGAGRASGARARVLFRRTRSFAVLMPGPWFGPPRCVRRRVYPPVSPVVFRLAGMARRFEGLRHAIMHPETHAQRLSRMIMRRIANKALVPRPCPPQALARSPGARVSGEGVWRPRRSHPKS